MHLSQLVAVETIETSPAVVAEAYASLGSDFVEKAVFVMERPESALLLDSVLSEVDCDLPHIMIAKRGQLSRWVRGLAWKVLTRRYDFVSDPMSTFLVASRRRWKQGTKPSEDPHLCDEMWSLLQEGSTADEIANHAHECPMCRIWSKKYFPTAQSRVLNTPINDVPKTLEVGIDGPPLLEEIFRRADKEGVDVVVLSSNSPAAQQPQWTLDALHMMAADPGLCLIVEDDRISPTPMDPCIIVRREHLLHGMQGFPPVTLRELSERLLQHAKQSGRRFRKMPLREVPPDFL